MWPRIVSALLGIWLMVAPSVLHYDATASISDRVLGPLIAATAIIAIWEVTRPLRWLGILFGLWLLIAPGIFDFPSHALANSAVVGAALVILSFLGGRVRGKYGGGWKEAV
ncbi:MAG TPA: hypothetical protein VFK39_10380 [Gemmatimonadaceae bacterium]|nr:hypothetical protein [Gemmatimonadaceae bacterium]